jgi:Spy/CpxP family protein refolding chaperone
MMRFSNRFLAVIAAVAVVAMAAQLAVAQNEKGNRGGRGRGGPGGAGGMGGPPSMARLAMIPKVQEALKITDEQKTKIEKINADFRKEMSGDRPDPEKMKKMRDEVTDKLKEVLDADQQKRLMGIFIQVMGAGSVMDPAVGKAIDLTDEQKDKLHEAMGPPPEGRDAAGGGQSFKERRAKMEKDVMAVLTPEQQKKLESLKGEKVDIDMSALRGPGGAGRGRDRGNRGEPKASKSSS